MGEPRHQVAATGEAMVVLDDFETVFVSLYPGLRRFAGAISPPEVDPDDLVQEALVRVLTRGGLHGIDHAPAYLRRAVLNVELARRRRQARWHRMAPLVATSAAGDPVYPSDLDELRRLDPGDRALLYLSAVEGWTFADVAEVLGRSEGSLRVRAHRLRRRLRENISEGTHDGSTD